MKGKRDRPSGWIYILQSSSTKECGAEDCYYKIGFAKNVEARLRTLKTSRENDDDLILFDKFPGHQEDETRLHRMAKAHIHRREWFRGSIEEFLIDLSDFRLTIAIKNGHGDWRGAEAWDALMSVPLGDILDYAEKHNFRAPSPPPLNDCSQCEAKHESQ